MKTDEQRNHCSSKGDIYPYDGASPLTGITLADPNPTVADFSDTGKSFDSFSIGNEILFQGRRYDKESNLYYYRARHYDPVMGRFLQNDPMGYHDSMNLYQAFNMNGVNYLDPFGKRYEIAAKTGGKYDIFGNFNFKVGWKPLDNTLLNFFNSLFNLIGFLANGTSNATGYIEDKIWDTVDNISYKLGMQDSRGDFCNLRPVVNAYFAGNPSNIKRGTQFIALKIEDIGYRTVQALRSKGAKILATRKVGKKTFIIFQEIP